MQLQYYLLDCVWAQAAACTLHLAIDRDEDLQQEGSARVLAADGGDWQNNDESTE